MNEIFVFIMYFMIYSFFGWILESVYKSVLQKKIVNSGFLAGPFCPIYGYGALIMYFSLKDVTNNIFVLFLFGMVALSVFEYIVGLFLEIVFQTKYWDYSNNKFNIQGRVCLLNSVYWGILGIVFMKVIHPFVEGLIAKIPENILLALVAVGVIYLLIDTINTTIKVIRINIKLKDWEEITEDIKNRIEAINAKNSIRFENINRLKREHKYKVLRKIVQVKQNEKVLGILKLRQHEAQIRLERRMRRLRRAFPTMKSERLTKFLDNYKKS